jgi:hypothetical protein
MSSGVPVAKSHPQALGPPKESHSMGTLDNKKRRQLPTQVFAFPKQRKEPIEDAGHVRSAIARFEQVTGVTTSERAAAWKRILAAAAKFGVEVEAKAQPGLQGR